MVNSKTCHADDCENVNYRKGIYCSDACSQRQKRKRRNGTASVGVVASVPKTGNLLDDAAAGAAMGLLSNGAADPVVTAGKGVLKACTPYAIEQIKNHPVRSFVFGLLGYWMSGSWVSCTETHHYDSEGNVTTSKVCKKPTALKRTGGVVTGVVTGNYIWEHILDVFSGGQPPVDPSYKGGHVLENSTQMTFLKAN